MIATDYIFGRKDGVFKGVGDLRIGQITSTAFELLFTPPSHSVGISHYKVYLNDEYFSDINESGDFTVNMDISTLYQVYIVAVDINGLESLPSNIEAGTTKGPATVPLVDLACYFKMDEEVPGEMIDELGNHNGDVIQLTNTIQVNKVGKINKGYQFYGDGGDDTTADFIALQNSLELAPRIGSEYAPFTVSFWAKFNRAGNHWLFTKRQGILSNVNKEWEINIWEGRLTFQVVSTNHNNTRSALVYVDDLLNTWVHFVCVFDPTHWSPTLVYMNNKKFTEPNTLGVPRIYPDELVEIGSLGGTSGASGNMDEIAMWKNRALTHGEVSDLFNHYNGVTL